MLRPASCSAGVGGTMAGGFASRRWRSRQTVANCGNGDFLFRNFLVLSLLWKEVSWQMSCRANYDNLGC